MKKYKYFLVSFILFLCGINLVEAKDVSQICYYRSDDSKLTFAVKAYDDGTSDAILMQPYTKTDFGENQDYRATWKNVGTALTQSKCHQYMKYTIKTGSNKIEFSTVKPTTSDTKEHILTNYNFLASASKCVYKGVNYKTSDYQVKATVLIDKNSIFTYYNDDLNTAMNKSFEVGSWWDTNKIEYSFYDTYDGFMKYFYDDTVGCPNVDTIKSYSGLIRFGAVADTVDSPNFGIESSDYTDDVNADKILKSYTVNFLKDGKVTNVVFYFRTYSSNTQKICIKVGNNAESCTVVQEGKEVFIYNGNIAGTWINFKVAKDQVSNLFQYDVAGDYSTLKDPNPVYFNAGTYNSVYLSKVKEDGSSSSGDYNDTLGAIYKNKICALKPYLQKFSPSAANYQLVVYDDINPIGTDYSIKQLPCANWGFDYPYECHGTNCNDTLESEVESRLKAIVEHCNTVYDEYSEKKKEDNTYSYRMKECQSFNTFYNQLTANKIIDDLSSDCSLLSEEMKDKLIFILDLIKIAGPILALGLGIVDFVKVIANGDADKEMKNAFKRFSIRVAAAALLFLIPVILAFLMDTFLGNQSGYNEDNPFCNIVDWND